MNILAEVRDAGRSRWKSPGALYLPQLQIAHVLKCLRFKHYPDNPAARLRRHTLLYGPTGAIKTTVCTKFLTDYAGAANIAIPSDPYVKGLVPTFLNMGGKSITWERMRGGCTQEGAFIPPLLMEADYYLAGELFSFLGHRQAEQAERMDVMNEIMEEGTVTVALNKMFNMSEKAREALEEEFDGKDDIFFNAKHAILSYNVNGVLFSASRFFTEEQEELLTTSGFKSRNNIASWHPSDSEDAIYRRRQFGKEDLAQTARIRDWNIRAWQTRFADVPYPDESMVNDVMDHYHDTYDRIRAETGLRIEQIGNTRDTMDAAQLLTASATIRVLSEKDWSKPGVGPVPTLKYIPSDVEWVKNFSQPRLNTLYDTLLGKNELDAKINEARETLVTFVSKKTGDYPNILEATPFTEYYASKTSVSIQTARRRLKSLRERGYLKPNGRLGEYTVSEDVMTDAGHTHPDFLEVSKELTH